MKVMNVQYIAIEKENGLIGRLLDMGYIKFKPAYQKVYKNIDDVYIFIILHDKWEDYGKLIINMNNNYNSGSDILLNIDDIPLREDFDEWVEKDFKELVRMYNEGEKMGLL